MYLHHAHKLIGSTLYHQKVTLRAAACPMLPPADLAAQELRAGRTPVCAQNRAHFS